VLGERLQVLDDARCEGVGGVAIVMEVELDLAEPGARELGELIEEVWPVLFAREEPAVARRSPIAVAERCERGIAIGPGIDPRGADLVGGTVPQGLVVIAECEKNASGAVRLWRTRTADQMPSVVTQPVLEVLLTKSA